MPYFGATGQVGWIDTHLFDEDLVLLGEDGVPFLDQGKPKAYRVSGKSWVNNHAHVLRARKEAIDWRLLTAQLNTVNYTGYVTGSTRLKLTQGAMNKLPLLVPPRAEQQRIADKLDTVLTRVDAVNTCLARVAPILKRFRQSVLAAATSGRLTEDWREVNPSISSWVDCQIGDLLREKPRNGYSPKAVDHETPVRSLTLSATTTGRFRPECFKFVPDDISPDSHLWIAKGDVLIQRANSLEYVGVSAVVDVELGGYIYPDLMMKCRANERTSPAFLHLLLSSADIRKYFREHATGTAGNMPKINQQTVIAAPCRLPTTKEQGEIVRRVEILFAFADCLETRLQAAQTATERLTPALLAKAFRGELVPQDPNDEPASELLRRLQQEAPSTSAKRGRKSAA
ncbi:restriction endonuclease subunit S [Chitinimonas taiwanensis]|uniref:restriction endonuclease subunit S n=1 Tax=Chitinimonas taiwanensis TaxID=240412 RepID=UPI0035B2F1B7